jgi:antitoxin component of MazEF toxin-antitoxin module
MKKKITKSKGSVTLEIDKAVADALGINQKSKLEMIVVNETLIIKAKNKKSSKKRISSLNSLTNSLMNKYEPVLKKLAKT